MKKAKLEGYLNLLNLLAKKAGMDISEIIKNIATELNLANTARGPYKRVKFEGEGFRVFYKPTKNELKKLMKETYVIPAGSSILNEMLSIIEEMSDKANGKKKFFKQVKSSVQELATKKAKEIVSNKEEDAEMSDRAKTNKTAKKPKRERLDGIKIYKNEVIDKKIIKSGIYDGCQIVARKNLKISPDAIFRNCEMINS